MTDKSQFSRIEKTVRNIFFIMIILFSIPFLFHGKLGDDWPSSQVVHFIPFRYGELNLETFLYEMYFNTKAWMDGQGRFMPLSVLSGGIFFSIFTTELSQNIFRLLIIVLVFVVWYKVVSIFLSNRINKYFFLLSLISCIRFRWDFDPHTGFGILLPLSTLLAGISFLLVYLSTKSNRLFSITMYNFLASLIFLSSVLTYELTFFLAPALIFMYISLSKYFNSKLSILKRFILSLPIFLTMIAYSTLVFGYLRPRSTPTGAYVQGFDLIESSRVFFINLLAPIPLLNIDFRSNLGFPSSNFFLAVFLIFGLCLVTIRSKLQILLQSPKSLKKSKTHGKTAETAISKIPILSIAFFLIVSPALTISLQPSWWNRIKWGNSYLGILLQEIGIVIIFTILFDVLKSKMQVIADANSGGKNQIHARYYKFASNFLVTFLSVSSIVVLANNIKFVENSHGRDMYSLSWAALSNNEEFKNLLRSKDLFLSETTNEAYDIHAASLYTFTGTRLAGIVFPPYLYDNWAECKSKIQIEKVLDLSLVPQECEINGFIARAQQSISNGSRSTFIDPITGIRSTNNSFIESFSDAFNFSFLPKFFQSNYQTQDWPSVVSMPGALDNNSVWLFDLFLVTPDTAIAYIFRMEQDGKSVDLKSGKIFRMSRDKSFVYKPNISGFCTESVGTSNLFRNRYGHVNVQEFQLPFRSIRENLTLLRQNFSVDPRFISLGLC